MLTDFETTQKTERNGDDFAQVGTYGSLTKNLKFLGLVYAFRNQCFRDLGTRSTRSFDEQAPRTRDDGSQHATQTDGRIGNSSESE